MTRKKSMSIKEIAQLCNVSIATVSRVINNSGRFSNETQEKILKAVEKYGYTPNMAAKSLKSSTSKTVGVIVPNISNEWFSILVQYIENFFFDHDYSVFICNTSRDINKEIQYFMSLDSKLVDGIICISGQEQLADNIISRDIPILCIDRAPTNQSNTHVIQSNHYQGGFLATEELIHNGCKRILVLLRDRALSVNLQRLNGYKDALKKNHLPIDENLILTISSNESNISAATKIILNFIDRGIPFDGIFATNDWRAYGALKALEERGIKVPEQVKIVGFDDVSISRSCSPTITSVKQNTEELALQASKILLELMNNKTYHAEEKLTTIPVSLIKRESSQKK